MIAIGRVLMIAVALLGARGSSAGEAPDFQREIRPILSEYCFQCHGFDEHARQGQLRLDQFEGATQAADSGAAAIVPMQADQSELIRRITSTDPDLHMPPLDTGKELTPLQIEKLREWIDAGAGYTKHWAFEKPVSQLPPEVQQRDWPHNMIDRFVLSRLEAAGYAPTAEAPPERLLRRVSLDLIGRPPTPEELDDFQIASARDPEAAYVAEVDRLLASPHFGERMAIDWMDAARYADTNGYFGDLPRMAWPWRDWVIQAFNDNLPFDQFTIQQLAGDLLPDATRDQRIATGFHRNSMANNETGIIDEEYRVEAVADRIDTTSAVWLGLTIGCAQCHDHKYDPITQREYYQLFAYFNSSVEPGLASAESPPPIIEVPTPEQTANLERCQRERGEAEHAFQAQAATLAADLTAWESLAPQELATLPTDAVLSCDFDPVASPATAVGTTLQIVRGIRGQAGSFDATQHIEIEQGFEVDGPWTISVWVYPTNSLCCIWSRIEPKDRRRGVELIWQKGRLQLNLVHDWGTDEIIAATRDPLPTGKWHHLIVSYDGSRTAAGLRVITNGQESPLLVHRDSLAGTLQCGEPLRIGRRDSGLGFYGLLDEFRVLPRAVTVSEATGWADSEQLCDVLARPAAERSASEQHLLKEYYIRHRASPELRALNERQQLARQAESMARAAIPTTLVMQDLPEPRTTHLLVRGQYDKLGDAVMPGVPSILPALATDASPNRLAMARWLVSPDHPLTARVAVNRLWLHCFGEGLVRTPNDFGSQGELPTHPELLDTLAVRFIDSGWDVKALLRLIVTSATYRQSSPPLPELLHSDPENRLWGRGPRFRLSAELVRDQALAVSGLLSDRIGGPSVKPYQPAGLWEEVSYNEEFTYVPDTDDGLWRRSLYTYWKRQVPPPTMLTFDANTREKCVIRRSRTNTPLQALVMLNDTTYVEAARALATLVRVAPGDDEARLRAMFRRVVSREPEPTELQVLGDLLQRQRGTFCVDVEAARQLLAVGASPLDRSIEASELAAWTLVAQTILNLDEVITRR